MRVRDAITLTAVVPVFGASLVLGFAAEVHAHPTAPQHDQVQEDEPGWDCKVNGNRICGPTNDQGVQAGCYNDQGSLVAVWPCHVVVDPSTGEGDVYSDLPIR